MSKQDKKDDKNKKAMKYKDELKLLQIELTKFQKFVKENGEKVLIIFEGRDAAGKGGAIKRFTEHLNPRGAQIVALDKPSDKEKTQWYFQRYISHLPSAGEIVFFDRSWYNRAGVEPVMGFCTKKENEDFLKTVAIFESLLVQSGIKIFKFFFAVNKDEQKKRFEERAKNPLKQYKLSSVDKQAQELWDKYTVEFHSMFLSSHTKASPWQLIRSNDKKKARINSIKYFLSKFDYPEKIDEKYLNIDEDVLISGDKLVAYFLNK